MVHYTLKDKGVEGMKRYGNMTRNLVTLSTPGKRTNILTFYGHFCSCHLGSGLLFTHMLVSRLNIHTLTHFATTMARNHIEYIIVLLKTRHIFKIQKIKW